MPSANIIHVTESNFEYEVLQYSRQALVLVDFWAEWCIPCKTLDPLLEKLTAEAEGSFRLAKINVDQTPRLAKRLKVLNIPMVKAFRDAEVIAEFNGMQNETFLRDFLRRVGPGPAGLQLEKASSLLQLARWAEAETTCRQILRETPGQPMALLVLAKSLLAQGFAKDASDLLKRFPASPEYQSAISLQPLAKAILGLDDDELAEARPLDATYRRALVLVKRGNFAAAMDGILAVLRQDKRYRGDEARQVIVGIFELLGDDHELTQQYRRELASVLY